MSEEEKNMELWKSVQQTDPRFTKSFSRAGGFSGTAINATYLIGRATKLWGPIGGAWGYSIEDEKYVQGSEGYMIHVLRIRFRYPNGEFPAYGQTTFTGINKNGPFTDEEAPKKSLTDAITKALSMLGFAADVHLGMYDDNKYVSSLREKFENLPKSAKPVAKATLEELSEETQKWLAGIADNVRNELNQKGEDAARKLIQEQGLSPDHEVGLWAFFDSKERAQLKRKAA